jgi:hypothetical protein
MDVLLQAQVEAIMRRYFALSVGSVLAGVMLVSAAAADTYFRRDHNGTWTNVEYNDGVCKYYYSHNSYDQDLKINRYGDCSRVAIGPDGNPAPVITGPVIVRQRPLASAPLR